MTPEYYKFPSGVQVIEISRYLTSNSAQAVQYLSRSSRIDGNNKHESPVDDLRKARDLIDDELFRVTVQNVIEKSVSPAQAAVLAGVPGSEPRQWNTLADVPGDVMRVTDRDGDKYRRVELHWEQQCGSWVDMSWTRVESDVDDGVEYAPYTEVIE